MKLSTPTRLSKLVLIASLALSAAACGRTDDTDSPTASLRSAIQGGSPDAAGPCSDACFDSAIGAYAACVDRGDDDDSCIDEARGIFAGCALVCAGDPVAEEPAAEPGDPVTEEPAAEPGVPGGDPGTLEEPEQTGTYRGYFCGEQQFIQTEGISAAEALANCELNAANNPDRQVLCTLDDQVIYGSCPSGDDDPCYCVQQADAVFDACSYYGYDAEYCGLVRVAQLDGCLSFCDVTAGLGNDDGGAPSACLDWEPAVLDRAPEFIAETFGSADEMACDGPSFRRFDASYGLWVGLVSCGVGYRFYLSESQEGPFLPAADGGGHGQDLCELVDPSFTITNDDDIQSGGCTACSIGRNYSFVAGEVFGRSTIGQPFSRAEAPAWGNYQSSVITCATGPLECGIGE